MCHPRYRVARFSRYGPERGNSSFGLLSRLAARATRPNSSPRPSTRLPPDVLPLPVAIVIVSIPSLVKDHFGALLLGSVLVAFFPILTGLVVGAVVALKFIYSAGVGDQSD